MAWILCSMSGWQIGQLFPGNLRISKIYTKGFYFTTPELRSQHFQLKLGIWGLRQRTLPRRIMLPPGDDHFSFSGQGMEETLKRTPSRVVQEISGKGKLDQIRQPSSCFEQTSNFSL
ncbi:neuromedin-S isoform 1-T4 [Hipposideros larvatus]